MDLCFASYDRLFPNQNTLPKGGLGNLIALPLQHGLRKSGDSVFADHAFKPYPDQWQYLNAAERLAREKLDEMISCEPFAKLSKVDDFIPQKRVISGGFNPRHGHLTDVCWKSKTTTSRVRKKVNHAHYKSYTR